MIGRSRSVGLHALNYSRLTEADWAVHSWKGQTLLQPSSRGDSETFFWPVQYFRRESSGEGFFKQHFPLPTAEFKSSGQALGERHEIIVEKNRAGLERAHHGRAIDFHQDVFLQIEAGVEFKRAFDKTQPGFLSLLPKFEDFAIELFCRKR